MWEFLFLALSQASISVSGDFLQLIFFGNWPPNIAALQTIAHATIQMMEENLPFLFVQLEEMHLILTTSLMFRMLLCNYSVPICCLKCLLIAMRWVSLVSISFGL